MKIDYLSKDLEVEEIGATFKSGSARIADKNKAYIFSILSGMYSDPQGSVVREITSNCYDAHTKAGKKDEPVIVRLHIDEEGQHFLEFVDKGTGISEDLLVNIYMSYGESDKRESDEYLGAFGLGSKSIFSCSEYYYLITRVDGTEYTYLINETHQGPVYNCLLEQQCDTSSNGTIVRVPIQQKDLKDWEQKILTQLRYFKNVFVLGFKDFNNDYKIRSFKTFQLREDLFQKDPHNKLHLVLGDVAYPINFSLLGIKEIAFNAALRFEIGELMVTPTREELKYSDVTVKAIKQRIEEFKQELSELILSPANLHVTNTYTHLLQQALWSKNYDAQLLVTNLCKEPISLLRTHLNNILITNNVKFQLKLGNNLLYINSTDTRNVLRKCTTCLLSKSRGRNYYNHVLSKDTESLEASIFFSSRDLNIKNRFAILEDDRQQLKMHERAYLNQEVSSLEYLVRFDEKLLKKHMFHNFLQRNSYKDFDLSQQTPLQLFLQLFNKFKHEYLNIDYKYVADYNIPDDYGKAVRTSNKKVRKEATFYFKRDGNAWDDISLEHKNVAVYWEHDTDGERRIIIYGRRKDSTELASVYSYFENLLKHRSSIIVVFTQEQNFHYFEKMENAFHISKAYSIEAFRTPCVYNQLIHLHTSCYFNQYTDSVDLIHSSYYDIDRFIETVCRQTKVKNNKLLTTFSKCVKLIGKQFTEFKKIAPLDHYQDEYTKCFKVVPIEIQKSVQTYVEKKYAFQLKAWKMFSNFTQSFEFELFIIDDYSYGRNTIRAWRHLHSLLQSKENKLNNFHKQILKLKQQ